VLGGGARLKSCRSAAAPVFYSCGIAVLFLLFGSRGLQNAIAEGDTRTISMHHIHTDEDITITFKRDGQYDEAALDKLSWFLRDWRREQQTRMDPHLIDLIWEVHRETGSKEPIRVVCGYRSPETNAMLRRHSSGVARFSQHMLGHAMDFYIPGVDLEQLRVIGLRLQRGGVGFYPTSGSPFVHMDTGGIRHWPRMTREQLVRVFPDGRTVHIPVDGRPLPGYALALADIRKRGDNPSEMSLAAARDAGMDVADAGIAHRLTRPFAKLFGLAHDDEEEESDAAVATAAAPAPPEPLRVRAKAALVAAVDRAEDKLAAEKVKLIKIAAKAHVISRAEAASAPTTPNQIILARGFWQGVPDGMTAIQPSAAAAKPAAAAASSRRTDVASTDAESTGSLGPFSTPREDRDPPEGALAYAEPTERLTPSLLASAAATSQAASRATVTGAVAVQTGANEMTIAMKRVSGRPASAILTVANKSAATRLAQGGSIDDPWLRAVVLSPSVDRFLCTTALGVRDFRSLAELMVKPANSVMMTFSADPQLGLATDHFSGSAIVFVSTVTYPLRTAELQ
jgi:uncharacterized protein YcbK (DUF882 family)